MVMVIWALERHPIRLNAFAQRILIIIVTPGYEELRL